MELRTFVTFEAKFPRDASSHNETKTILPDGKAIADCLSEDLRAVGLEASKPVQHSFYGWSFDVNTASARIWYLLQFSGPWLLLCEEKCSFFDKLVGKRHELELCDVLRRIHQILTEDQRFSSVTWFTQAEYESGNERGESAPC